jgi:hypothetical protein
LMLVICTWGLAHFMRKLQIIKLLNCSLQPVLGYIGVPKLLDAFQIGHPNWS